METNKCVVCGNAQKVQYRLQYRVYKCPVCKLESSDAVFDESFQSALDPALRDAGIKQLRFKNFNQILGALTRLKGASIQGLEIGSGTGWWLETCRKKGIACEGVEPETAFAAQHAENGLQVHYGFYPLPAVQGKKYDFIIFNDVFEHIPDLDALIKALAENLADDGLLIINIPMSDGFFYKLSTLLFRLGSKSYLERMWQFRFHSPHMNYFNAANLQQLLSRYNFTAREQFPLDTLDYSTLKERLKTDTSAGKLKTTLLSAVLPLTQPFSRFLSPDIRVFFFRKTR